MFNYLCIIKQFEKYRQNIINIDVFYIYLYLILGVCQNVSCVMISMVQVFSEKHPCHYPQQS